MEEARVMTVHKLK